MKKLYTLFIAALINSATAQEANMTPPDGQIPITDISIGNRIHAESNDRAAESFWLFYGGSKRAGQTPVKSIGYYTNLFQDTTVLVEGTPGTYNRPRVHSVGNVLDPLASDFSVIDGVTWTPATTYTVDSIGIGYLYERQHPDPTIVDTLIVYLYNNAASANLGSCRFNASPSLNTNYGMPSGDSLFYKQMYYDYTKNRPANATGGTPSGMVTFKIPLTAADVSFPSTAWKYFYTNTFAVPAGKLAITAYSFKPGFTYAFNDTLSKNKNNFMFLSYEEQGADTYPIYSSCPYPHNICDWNVSSIVRPAERYNTGSGASSWNGFYLPTWAFTNLYGTEHHFIDYKVTTGAVGINESKAIDGIKLGQNRPNPFNGNTVINYEISNSETVSLNVFDIAGKKVLSVNQGKQSAGIHSIELSSQNLLQGVYFYTLTVGNSSVTKKMTVIE